jgi:hypothetical protein
MCSAFGPFFFFYLLFALCAETFPTSAERLEDKSGPAAVESQSSAVANKEDTVDSKSSFIPHRSARG